MYLLFPKKWGICRTFTILLHYDINCFKEIRRKTLEIKGQIIDLIYQNETNGYTVAEFETEEELTTVVGYLPFINKGDSLKLEGKFVVHQDYGRQFKIETFEKSD